MKMWDTAALVDRCAEHRSDEAWLSAQWGHDGTRVLHLDERSGLSFSEQQVEFADPVGPYDRTRHWLLGRYDGVCYFAERTPGSEGRSLRELGVGLADADSELATMGVALANWHAGEPYCARCGAATDVVSAGWARRCPGCGTEHFPRHDPAMIVSVLDADDRLLLAHQDSWPRGRFSVLAGFCEAGESLEQCVHREVMEEVGVPLAGVRYLVSQPWPVPRSLMTAFVALAAETTLRPDQTEIADARWLSRDEYRAAIADGTILRPASRSVAHWMIDRWLDGELRWEA